MRRVFVLLSFLLFGLTAPACASGFPASYSGQPIRGWVVDSSTGQPLDGVVIVAQWILYEATVGGENPHKRLQVLEAVTGPDGSYAFPGWGPKPNLPTVSWPLGYGCCFLTDRDPKLSFFKPGYRPLTVLNRRSSESAVRTSDWDGKTIELELFKDTRNKWARELDFLQGSLGWGDLDWRTCPKMVLAIEEERLRFGFSPSEVPSLSSLGTSLDEVRRALRNQP